MAKEDLKVGMSDSEREYLMGPSSLPINKSQKSDEVKDFLNQYFNITPKISLEDRKLIQKHLDMDAAAHAESAKLFDIDPLHKIKDIDH